MLQVLLMYVPFLIAIKVQLVYDPNYSSCFPPGWY